MYAVWLLLGIMLMMITMIDKEGKVLADRMATPRRINESLLYTTMSSKQLNPVEHYQSQRLIRSIWQRCLLSF